MFFFLTQSILYWDDWKMNSVFSADKDHGIMIRTVAEDMLNLMDLKIFAHSIQEGSNACTKKSPPCSHFCVGAPKDSYKCLCPDGMHLSSNSFDCLCPDDQKPFANNSCAQSANTCAPGFFSCSNKLCVPMTYRCDGKKIFSRFFKALYKMLHNSWSNIMNAFLNKYYESPFLKNTFLIIQAKTIAGTNPMKLVVPVISQHVHRTCLRASQTSNAFPSTLCAITRRTATTDPMKHHASHRSARITNLRAPTSAASPRSGSAIRKMIVAMDPMREIAG